MPSRRRTLRAAEMLPLVELGEEGSGDVDLAAQNDHPVGKETCDHADPLPSSAGGEDGFWNRDDSPSPPKGAHEIPVLGDGNVGEAADGFEVCLSYKDRLVAPWLLAVDSAQADEESRSSHARAVQVGSP